MRTAIDDLSLDHLRIVYPGQHRYPVDERITAWPLADIDELPAAVRGRRRTRTPKVSANRPA